MAIDRQRYAFLLWGIPGFSTVSTTAQPTRKQPRAADAPLSDA